MSSDSETSQETPGAIVREARKSLGLSLADIAAMTRIPKTMLKHLEADRYDEYSAEVFARGHLRNYAREVDLEPELVLQAFDRYTGRTSSESSESVDVHGSEADTDDEEMPLGPSNGLLNVEWDHLWDQVRVSHLLGVGLILFAIFTIFSFATGNSATARDSSEFSESNSTAESNWNEDFAAERVDKSEALIDSQSGESTTTSADDD